MSVKLSPLFNDARLDASGNPCRRGYDQARLLTEKRDKLLQATDTAFPGYPKARAAFAGESPEVDALKKGLIGIVSKLKTTQGKQAVRRLMRAEHIGPLEASAARKAMERESPEVWQGVKRAFIQDRWEHAGRETLEGEAINQGPKFRKPVLR